MNRYLLFFILLPFSGLAQVQEYQKQLSAISAMEGKAAAGALEKSGVSAASNNFDVQYYRCEWTVDPRVRYITGKVTAKFTITTSGNTITFDLSNQLVVDSVLYHNNKISFQLDGTSSLSLQLPSTLSAGVKDSVHIFYQGVPPTGGGFWQMFFRRDYGIWTLSEPYGARDWWPCKNGLDR